MCTDVTERFVEGGEERGENIVCMHVCVCVRKREIESAREIRRGKMCVNAVEKWRSRVRGVCERT